MKEFIYQTSLRMGFTIQEEDFEMLEKRLEAIKKLRNSVEDTTLGENDMALVNIPNGGDFA
jgi:hypothetical protein